MKLLSIKVSALTTFFLIFVLGIGLLPAGAQIRDLTRSSTGTDVVTLQQYLVTQGYLVMPIGVAYGYFGPLTQRAVAEWQVENDVSPTAGYWGPISKARYAEVTNAVSVISPTPNIVNVPVPNNPPVAPAPNLVPSPDTLYALGMRADQVRLFRAFPYEVRSGDLIALDGSGFSKTMNKIYFNNNSSVTATSMDGVTLEVVVPAGLKEGKYELSVSNMLGSSKSPDYKVLIKVTKNPQPAPKIESVSIAGDVVTVIGSGFTSSNDLLTTLGNTSRPASSNGTSLTFNLTDLSRYNQVKQFSQGKYKVALWIYVQNKHGINKEPYMIETTI